MKIAPRLVASAFLALGASAHAQIFFETPGSITDSSNISTLGTFVDALGANDFGAPVTIGDTKFNTFFSDGTIAITGPLGGGTDGSHSTATPYQTVLDDVAYVGFSQTPVTATVTLSNLHPGDVYQVQVFNGGNRFTDIIGANTVALSDQYTIGRFTATGSTESFSFGPVTLGDAGEIGAIALRNITDVPEPSTYALVGVGLLSIFVFRKLRKLSI